MMRVPLRLMGLACGLLMVVGAAWAHKGSDAYLDVQQVEEAAPTPSAGLPSVRSYRFKLAVALKDLDLLLPLDANADGRVTWGEVKAALPLMTALADETVQIDGPQATQSAGGSAPTRLAASCRLDWRMDGLDRRGDGAYVRFAAQAHCPTDQGLALRYTLLGDQDANHRLLVAGRIGGRDLLTTRSPLQKDSLVLAAASGPVPDSARPQVSQAQTGLQTLGRYLVLGAEHLLQGYDHLAFLLALVLPLRLTLFRKLPVVAMTKGGAGQFGTMGVHAIDAWWALLRTVTAFTVGHSLTLALAVLGMTQVSPSWVEPAIAVTIAFTALLNLRPLPWVRTEVLALVFGMVHGYGFAGLLLEADAPRALLPWALGGFNLGVEAGQLIAVGSWVLLSQVVVARPWYPAVVVRGGSMLLVVLAAFWFWQRVV